MVLDPSSNDIVCPFCGGHTFSQTYHYPWFGLVDWTDIDIECNNCGATGWVKIRPDRKERRRRGGDPDAVKVRVYIYD